MGELKREGHKTDIVIKDITPSLNTKSKSKLIKKKKKRAEMFVTPTGDGTRSRGGHAFVVMSLARKSAGPVQTWMEKNAINTHV